MKAKKKLRMPPNNSKPKTVPQMLIYFDPDQQTTTFSMQHCTDNFRQMLLLY